MDPCLLYLGTEDGIRVLRTDGSNGTDTPEVDSLESALRGESVRAIAVSPDDPNRAFVGCGLRGWGLHRTDDGGKTFETVAFEDEWVWGLTWDDGLFVGTEPPMCYRRTDGEFVPFDAIDDVPSREDWSFFYEPFEAGHLHGISVSGDRIVAGIEHGALVYSHDGGETWHDALVGYDLHRTAFDPTDDDRILAGAGEGLFESTDAGRSWSAVSDLREKYVHGIHFVPNRPERVYAYADEDSPLYRSENGGRTWSTIGALPAAGPADPFAFHPTDAETLFYVGTPEANEEDDEGEGSDTSQLFVSEDAGETWERFGPALPKAWRLQTAPGE